MSDNWEHDEMVQCYGPASDAMLDGRTPNPMTHDFKAIEALAKAADLVKRLRVKLVNNETLGTQCVRYRRERLEAADTIESLTSQLAEAREALKPFADLLDTRDYEREPDDCVVRSAGTMGRDYSFITVGDLRRAYDALKRTTDAG